VGRTAAVVDFGFVRLTGFVAWLVWGLVHIYFLVGFRNPIAVALDWLWAYVSFQRGARLITDMETRGTGSFANTDPRPDFPTFPIQPGSHRLAIRVESGNNR
jgi:hypothetical protein